MLNNISEGFFLFLKLRNFVNGKKRSDLCSTYAIYFTMVKPVYNKLVFWLLQKMWKKFFSRKFVITIFVKIIRDSWVPSDNLGIELGEVFNTDRNWYQWKTGLNYFMTFFWQERFLERLGRGPVRMNVRQMNFYNISR